MKNITGPINKLQIIKQLPVFSDLNVFEKTLVAGSCQLVEYNKGDVVYNQGDAPDYFYCVVNGRAQLFLPAEKKAGQTGLPAEKEAGQTGLPAKKKAGQTGLPAKKKAGQTGLPAKKGKMTPLEYIRRGQYFGIISLLTGEPHSVSVRLVNDSLLLRIDKNAFDALLKKVPRLAVHFSRSLSRRLKRKDQQTKSVFESTIISVFSTCRYLGKTTYAVNLGLSLNRQTNKKALFLDMGRPSGAIALLLNIKAPKDAFSLADRPFDGLRMKSYVMRFSEGVDVLTIKYEGGQEAPLKARLGYLFTYLTGDYHYIIADLPDEFDDYVFESLRQSDIVHLISDTKLSNLKRTSGLIKKVKASLSDEAYTDLSVVLTKSSGVNRQHHERMARVLGSEILAKLPDLSNENGRAEYDKTIHFIARRIAGLLVGLVLGSGGALATSQIGVLKVFEKEKIPIDVIAGASMGALIGALWAFGIPAAKIEGIIGKFNTKLNLLKLVDLSFRKGGLIKGGYVADLLRKHLGDAAFYDLKTPLKIVACNIKDGTEVVIDRGGLITAVRASTSISGIFQPVSMGDKLLVDGGVVNPVPANVLTQMGIKYVIAVNALPEPGEAFKTKKKKLSMFDIIIRSMHTTECILAKAYTQLADIIIHPIISGVEWYEFYRSEEFIKKGVIEARKALPEIKALLSDVR